MCDCNCVFKIKVKINIMNFLKEWNKRTLSVRETATEDEKYIYEQLTQMYELLDKYTVIYVKTSDTKRYLKIIDLRMSLLCLMDCFIITDRIQRVIKLVCMIMRPLPMHNVDEIFVKTKYVIDIDVILDKKAFLDFYNNINKRIAKLVNIEKFNQKWEEFQREKEEDEKERTGEV